MSTHTPVQSAIAPGAGASCADAPTAPTLDVVALSAGLPDGVYYAGLRLTPWMSFKDRLALTNLEPFYARDNDARRALYQGLRTRRAGESIVVRWEIDGGLPGVFTVCFDRHQEVDVDSGTVHALRERNTVDRAFIWGPAVGHVDVYRLGHWLLDEAMGSDMRQRSTNHYTVQKAALTDSLGDAWVIARTTIRRAVFAEDMCRARRALDEAVDEARAEGVDVDAVLDGYDAGGS